MINALIDGDLDSELVCGSINFCKKTFHKQTVEEYVREILADNPNIPAPTPSGKKTYKILHLTDVHVDLEYTTVNCKIKSYLNF